MLFLKVKALVIIQIKKDTPPLLRDFGILQTKACLL